MKDKFFEHLQLLRRATRRYKAAARASLALNLLDERMTSIKLNMDATLKGLLDLANSLATMDGSSK